MATYTAGCSSVGGFGYAGNFTLYVELANSGGNPNTNISTVWYKVYCSSNGSGSINSAHFEYFELNGTVIKNENVSVSVSSPNAYIPIAEGHIDVGHNADGTKTVSFNAQIRGLTYGVSSSVSGNFTLDTIPRYANLTSLSVSGRTSSSLTLSFTADKNAWIFASLDGGASWLNNGQPFVSNQSSGSFTISSLTSNTTYNVTVLCRAISSTSSLDTRQVISGTTFAQTISTISLSSKSVNHITVSSSCNVAVSSTQYRIKTYGGSYGSYQNSATFSSLTPNTTYVIQVRKIGQASGEAGTAEITVATYQIATISSAPNINHGDNETITYSNPSGGTIAIAIYNTAGTTAYAAYRTCSGNSYTFSFTDTELDSLYKLYGNNNTITVRVYLRTSANNVNYTNYKNITITLTGNQKTGYTNVNGTWKRTKRWVKVDGTWKRCVRWINVNGTWKRCI